MLQKKVKLNNGKEIPIIGLGTWRINGKEYIRNSITSALEIGYRHIDTAWVYENEQDIGIVLSDILKNKKFNIKREDLFITSKLWNTFHHNVKEGVIQTLRHLKLEYLDLYLVHWPVSFKSKNNYETDRDKEGNPILLDFDPVSVWKQMEELVESGLTKSIGVANFGTQNLTKILENCRIKPVINQFELHPYLKQTDLQNFCTNHNIQIQSYLSLGSSDNENTAPNLKEDPLLSKIAQNRNITTSQLILSYLTHKNICVIPKSTNPTHIHQNSQLIQLTDQEVQQIESIKTEYRYVDLPSFGKDRFK
ncbi:aldo-keto reductase [Hamiltosporidium magnivora]|uniref:Aldo-keto reductase n=1 Tax=Hamiltosporidium magnivora TaxID=148818 RepID=A0A4Q9L3C6_9MICR|nr:aldo-keto reductase [Hamiltosporidium magnivora]